MYEIEELFKLYRDDKLKKKRLKASECRKLLTDNAVIIYGAGNSGSVLYKRFLNLSIDVLAFWDEQGSIFGDDYNGLPIVDSVGINKLISPEKHYVVIVTMFDIMSFDKIKQSICDKWKGKEEQLHVIYFTQLREYDELFTLDLEPRFSAYLGEEPSYLAEHQEDILMVNRLLNDNESRIVYKELINYYMMEDFIKFTVHPFEEHYFDYKIYSKSDEEVFVDCGAYTGDTLDIFLHNNNSFKSYYAIEADKVNCSSLERLISEKRVDNIHVFNNYISDRIKEVGFDSEGTSYSSSSNNQNRILTKTLDELVYNSRPSFVKINIEGADLDAIKGAHGIISDFHPIVACQGHHRADHLWKIVETIEEYGIGYYTYYLRNYKGITEFTFYAIPEHRLLGRMHYEK